METKKHSLSFGQFLQAVRLRKGVSIDEVSRETRVGLNVLRSIEKEDPEGLPADVYVKGFLRAYAKVVDADGDEAVRRFDAWRQDVDEMTEAEARPVDPGAGHWRRVIMALGGFMGIIALTFFIFSFIHLKPPLGDRSAPPVVPPSGPEISEEADPGPVSGGDAATETDERRPDDATEADVRRPDDATETPDAAVEKRPSATVETRRDVAIRERPDEALEEPPAAERPDEAAPEPPDAKRLDEAVEEPPIVAVTERSEARGRLPGVSSPEQPMPSGPRTGEGPAGSSPDAAPGKLTLVITTIEDTWMKVIIDGVSPREYSLKPGKTMTLEASSTFNLLIGNAGGVKLSLNDAPVDIPKKSGQVVTLQLP